MPPKPHVGRKTKLTPETQQLIIQALSVGATHRIACEYAGIHQDTFYLWLQKGAEGKPPYSEFSEAVTRTQGRAAVGWLAKIEAAGAEDWRALAFKLERRYPDEYGKQLLGVEHSGVMGVVQLPSKAPTAEAWLAETQHLHPEQNGHAQ